VYKRWERPRSIGTPSASRTMRVSSQSHNAVARAVAGTGVPSSNVAGS